MDKSLNETAADKIRKYRSDYNNNPPNSISFIPTIASTSGSLHSEFIRILFLQVHRETDRFGPILHDENAKRSQLESTPLDVTSIPSRRLFN